MSVNQKTTKSNANHRKSKNKQKTAKNHKKRYNFEKISKILRFLEEM